MEFAFDPTNLAFDEAAHEYRYDGVRFISVTRALRATGFIVAAHYTEQSRLRGEYVHKACALLDEQDLHWETLDPRLTPYVAAYQNFLGDTGFQPALMEFPVCHPVYRFAGTLDRVGKIAGRMALVDIKTGNQERWHALQLAAYAGCFKEKLDRYALYLGADGKYSLSKPFTNPRDWNVFLSAVACANWQASA